MVPGRPPVTAGHALGERAARGHRDRRKGPEDDMTTTSVPPTATTPAASPASRLPLRVAAIAAVVGPLLYAGGVLAHPPEHLDRAAQLAEVAAAPTRWIWAHLLVAGAAVGLLPALLGFAAVVRSRFAAGFAATTAVLGLPALYGIVALELVLGEMADASADRVEMVALGERVFAAPAVTGALFIPSTLWTLGLVVLAITAARSRLLAKWNAAVLVVAALAAAVPGGATRTAGAVLLVVGMLPVAAVLHRAAMSDRVAGVV